MEGCLEEAGWFSVRNGDNYTSLPYNPNLLERAKELRKAGNLPEVIMWQQLHKRKFKGYDFDRQKIIGNFIVDFYCTNCNVVIEIDGSSHNNKVEYDKCRDEFLASLGLTIIRIKAEDVMNDLNKVIDFLHNHPKFFAEPPRRLRRHPSTGGE